MLLSTWMYRITANWAFRLLSDRGQGRSEALDDAETPPDGRRQLQREAVVEVGCRAEELRAALIELPFPLRAVVVLHDIYGVDHEAIAVELDITMEQTKTCLSQARLTLRRQLFPLPAEKGHVLPEDMALLTSATGADALAIDGPSGCGPGPSAGTKTVTTGTS